MTPARVVVAGNNRPASSFFVGGPNRPSSTYVNQGGGNSMASSVSRGGRDRSRRGQTPTAPPAAPPSSPVAPAASKAAAHGFTTHLGVVSRPAGKAKAKALPDRPKGRSDLAKEKPAKSRKAVARSSKKVARSPKVSKPDQFKGYDATKSDRAVTNRPEDDKRCKARPDNKPKGGGGGRKGEFIPWCK